MAVNDRCFISDYVFDLCGRSNRKLSLRSILPGAIFRQSVGCYYHKFWFVRKIF